MADKCVDDEEYRNHGAKVRVAAEEFLREWWGEKCPDYEPNCASCQRWKCLEFMLSEPGAEFPFPITDGYFEVVTGSSQAEYVVGPPMTML